MNFFQLASVIYDSWPTSELHKVRYLLPVPFEEKGSSAIVQVKNEDSKGWRALKITRQSAIPNEILVALAQSRPNNISLNDVQNVSNLQTIEISVNLDPISILNEYIILLSRECGGRKIVAHAMEFFYECYEIELSDELVQVDHIEKLRLKAKQTIAALYDLYLPSLFMDELLLKKLVFRSTDLPNGPFVQDVLFNSRMPDMTNHRSVMGKLDFFKIVHWEANNFKSNLIQSEIYAFMLGERHGMAAAVLSQCFNRTEEAHYLIRTACEILNTLEFIDGSKYATI